LNKNNRNDKNDKNDKNKMWYAFTATVYELQLIDVNFVPTIKNKPLLQDNYFIHYFLFKIEVLT
jgi:hypothetical protein